MSLKYFEIWTGIETLTFLSLPGQITVFTPSERILSVVAPREGLGATASQLEAFSFQRKSLVLVEGNWAKGHKNIALFSHFCPRIGSSSPCVERFLEPPLNPINLQEVAC